MAKNNGKETLGRGLDAIISNDYFAAEALGSSSINEIPLTEIIPNEDQPRTQFEEESLSELAESIRNVGIIQPITVNSQGGTPPTYKIISGERRYRAAKMAGLLSIPAYIKTAEDEQVMEMALIENIQREDLNAIEISLAFKRLIDEYGLTQNQLSGRVGKKRATISNYLRLLRLPAEIQMGIKNGKIDMGHARAMLSIEDPALQLSIYEHILSESLSVRQVEQLIREYNSENEASSKPLRKRAKQKTPEEFGILANRFSHLFKTKVSLSCDEKGKGRITIPFATSEQLEEIVTLLDKL